MIALHITAVVRLVHAGPDVMHEILGPGKSREVVLVSHLRDGNRNAK